MKRLLVPALALVVLLLGAPVALANGRPPLLPSTFAEPSVTVAAVAGGAGAVLAGLWLIRRPKP